MKQVRWLWIAVVAGVIGLEGFGSATQAAGAAPQVDLAKAVEFISQYDFDHAYPMFQGAWKARPEGSDAWQQGLYGAAVCKQQMMPAGADTKAEARTDFTTLVEKTPRSKYAPRAMLNLGRMAELKDFHDDTVDLNTARQWYTKVMEGWPDDPIAGEAALRLSGSYILCFDQDNVNKGIAILEKWLADHPKDPLASGMWQYLADTYFYPLANYKKTVEDYKKAEAIGWMQPGRQGGVYWRLAILLERELKDPDGAAEYYTKIITETPTSGKAYESQLALKRLGKPVPEIEIFAASKAAKPAEPVKP